jgi:hypothetical protein
MLDRAADAATDVERRLDDLPSLPDLELIGNPSRVRGGATGANGPAEDCREIVERRESLGASDAPSAGDDDARLFEVGDRGLRRV